MSKANTILNQRFSFLIDLNDFLSTVSKNKNRRVHEMRLILRLTLLLLLLVGVVVVVVVAVVVVVEEVVDFRTSKSVNFVF